MISALGAFVLLELVLTLQGFKFDDGPRFGNQGPSSSSNPNKPSQTDIPEHLGHLDVGKAEMRDIKATLRSAGPESVPAGSSDVCMTSGCVESAAIILQNMDETVKPCDDFYQFTCGNYIRNAVIPQTHNSVSYFTEISLAIAHKVRNLLEKPENASKSDQDVRVFFQSCMNEPKMESKGLEPIIEMVARLGTTIPMLVKYPNQDALNVNNLLKQMMKHLMADSALFGIDTTNDIKDSRNKNLLVIYSPTLEIVSNIFSSDSPKMKRIQEFYKLYLVEVAKRYRDHIFMTRYLYTQDVELEHSIGNIIALQKALLKISKNSNSSTTLATFKEFQDILKPELCNGVDIPGIVKHTLKNLVDFELTNTTMIEVSNWEYFRALPAILSQVPREELINLLIYQKMVDFSPATTRAMRALDQAFNGGLTGLTVAPPRWETCVQETVNYFGAKVSKMLIQEENGDALRKETLEMIKQLKAAFSDLINEASWMDKETRTKAQEKLKSIETNAVFTDNVDKQVINKVYQGMANMTEDGFLDNLFNLQTFWTHKSLKKLTSKPDFEGVNDQSFDSGLVNAMYSPTFNAIWIPLGILHPPMFRHDRLAASNYGALGMILGHELTHAFDNHGANFDKDGNLKNWWTNATLKAFQARQQCFIDQYSNVTYDFLKKIPGYEGPTAINGTSTLGESIADNGGLREAWRAYGKYLEQHGNSEPTLPGLSKYNHKQIFFMSFGTIWCETRNLNSFVALLELDPHPPHGARVRNTLKNMPEFATTFGCAANDPMNTPSKCQVW